jgi:membrane associated rhomboid family serine protease
MPDLPRRVSRPSGSRPIIGRLTPTIRSLLIAEAVIYAVYLLVRPLRPAMDSYLAIGTRFFAGALWQPLTALFVHLRPEPLIFSLLGIWWAGGDVERARGTGRMLGLFIVGGIASNLAFAGVAHRLFGAFYVGPYFAGATYAVLTLFAAYGRIYGRTLTNLYGMFQVQARYIAMAFIGWEVVMALAGEVEWPSLAGIAAATAVGYFGAAPGGFEGIMDALKLRRLRRRYRVLEGGAGRPKKYVN